ncbi:MAG TPA: hypothetical protein VFR58_10885 [Flavisolibacter sp.]|nr:hypothetical protein [Flavisolibacter sp.]
MARIFTTKFTFNHQVYDAIVTVLDQNGELNFTVKVQDLDLQELLPDGHFQYRGRKGFKDIETDKLSQSLMQSIAASIEKHLVSKP